MSEIRFRVEGLSQLDKLEFQEQVDELGLDDNQAYAFEESESLGGSYGEPVTIAIIVGGLALKALIAFLAIRSTQTRFSEKIEVEYPDGRKVKHHIKFTIAADKPLSEQVLAALGKVTDLAPSQLLGGS